jgi:adenosine deaminase
VCVCVCVFGPTDGSVRPETILELAREQKVELPTYDIDELRDLICVKDDCPSLVEYLRGFYITGSVLQKAYAITRVMYELCEDCVDDGITYAEVRFSPILHTLETLTLSAGMERNSLLVQR